MAAVVLASCFLPDFGWEVVAVNESTDNVVVQVEYLENSSEERTFFVPVPVGATRLVFVWGHPLPGPSRLVVLDVTCRPIRERLDGGVAGLTIRITDFDGRPSISFDESGSEWTGPRPNNNDRIGLATCDDAVAAMDQ